MESNQDGARIERARFLTGRLGTAKRVLAGDITLNSADPFMHFLNANGVDRNVTLFTAAGGELRFLANVGSVGILHVVAPGGASVADVSPGEVATLIASDVDWKATKSGAATEANTFTDTQTINPPTGGTHQGLVINQTLPGSGSPIGPVILNTVTVTNPGLTTATVGFDAFGQFDKQIVGLRINYASQGAGSNNGAFGVAHMVTGPTDGYGAAIGITANANLGSHYLWGHIGYATVWAGATVGALIGIEAEIGVATGGAAAYRIGVSANSQAPVQGSTLDAAFSVSAIANQLPGGVGTTSPFQHLMAISTALYGFGNPIAATGDLLFSEAPITLAHGWNLPNVTFTGNVIDTPPFTVTGVGTASLGPKGTATNAILVLAGGEGTGIGAVLEFSRNAVLDWLVGHQAAITAAGTSKNLRFQKLGLGAVLELDATTGQATFLQTIRTAQSTVALLPSASTSGAGSRGFVTDGSTTFTLSVGQTVVGGGSAKVPVYSDGTNWIVG